MKKVKILFLILIFFTIFISCNKKVFVEEKKDSKTEKTLDYYYLIVSDKDIEIYEKNMKLEKEYPFDFKIKKVFGYGEKIYILSEEENLYLFNRNLFSPEFSFIFKEKPTIDDIAIISKGFYYISKNSFIFKDRNREVKVVSIDTSFLNLWKNPFHNFVYLLDENGFLYSIDIVRKILVRRLYIGNIRDLKFSKYGTRLIIAGENALYVLDYESLNIIDRKEDLFTNVMTFQTNPLFYLYSSYDGRLLVFDGLKYSQLERINVKDRNSILNTFQDSLLLICSSKGIVDIFKKDKRLKELNLKNKPIENLLDVRDTKIFFKSSEGILIYDMLKDSIKSFKYPKSIKYFEIFLKDISSQNQITETGQNEYYTIQIFSLTNEVSLSGEIERLKERNPSDTIFVSDTIIMDKKIFRIFLGLYSTFDQAEIKRDELIKKGYGRDILIKKITIND